MPYSKIVLTHSTTPEAVPNLIDLDVAELAVNVTDGKLYTKNNSNELIVLSDSALEERVYTLEQNPGTWGSISGTLSDQSDLQNVLNTKSDIDDLVFSAEDAVGGGINIVLAKSDSDSTLISLLSDNLDITQDVDGVNIDHKDTLREDTTNSQTASFGSKVDVITGVESNDLGHITSATKTTITFPSLPNWEDRISALEYVPIDITSFSIFPADTLYEYFAQGVDSDLLIQWESNSTPTSLTLTDPVGVTIENDIFATAYIDAYSINPPSSGASTTKQWTLNVTHIGAQTSSDSASKSITWIYPFYHGAHASDLSDGTDIQTSLTKLLQTKGNKTITIHTNNEFIYFAYPSYYGDITTILDGNGFNVTASFTKYTSTITHALSSVVVDYTIYKSNSVSTINQNFEFKY